MTTAGQPTGYYNQTYAVEFEVSGSLDGVTPSPNVIGSPPSGQNPDDPQNLFKVPVEDLGLVNPDYTLPDQDNPNLGTTGNRLVTYLWIEGSSPGAADASVDVVDATDGTTTVQKNIGTFVGDTTFFREGIFVPQGSMIRVRGMTGPVKVRLHIQFLNNAKDLAAVLQAICCIESENGNGNGDGDLQLMAGPSDFRGPDFGYEPQQPGVESFVTERSIGGVGFSAFRLSPVDPSSARWSYTLPRRGTPVGRYSITVTLEYSDVEPAPSFAGLLGIAQAEQPDDLGGLVFSPATDIQVQSVGIDTGEALSVLEWEFVSTGNPFVACILTKPDGAEFPGIIYLYQATLRFLGA